MFYGKHNGVLPFYPTLDLFDKSYYSSEKNEDQSHTRFPARLLLIPVPLDG